MATKKARSLANGEQGIIPEMAPVRIDKIHRAAKRYATERDIRCAASLKEKESHLFLIQVMKEQGLNLYAYGDLTVMIDSSEKAKVKTGSDAKGEESNEVGEE